LIAVAAAATWSDSALRTGRVELDIHGVGRGPTINAARGKTRGSCISRQSADQAGLAALGAAKDDVPREVEEMWRRITSGVSNGIVAERHLGGTELMRDGAGV
jgi:hypothetical protein